MSTRGALEAQLRKADSLHLTDEAFNLRRRLRSGDFEVGDRIHLVFQTTGSLTALGLSQIDTVIVQAGKMVIFPPPIDSISLDGVLFSELTSAINVRVSKYFKDVVVRAVPLMRLSVTGAIARPGYYYFPTDSPLSDLLMRGGGQGPGSDMPKSAIRRGSRVCGPVPTFKQRLPTARPSKRWDCAPATNWWSLKRNSAVGSCRRSKSERRS